MRIAIATSTRADWGLLSPLARALKERGAIVEVLATGMHLDDSYGHTIDEIRAEGWEPTVVPVTPGDDPALFAAGVTEGFGRRLRMSRPDALVILGDRAEMLAVALGATVTGVPIVHIAGGTVSEGAIDDNVRHAITKLSTLHLVETERCAGRVIAMGESPDRVTVAGALGVENILSTQRMDLDRLIASLGGWRPGERNVLATLHAETRGEMAPREAMKEFIEGVGDVMADNPDLHIIMTHPNSDVPPEPQIALMQDFERSMPERVKIVPSLGRVRYMTVLDFADAVIGNSSGGIVEVPSAGVPVLDIGDRQKGREHGPGVWHCGPTRAEIATGLRHVLSPEARQTASRRENPYSRPHTSSHMADAIMTYPFRPFPSKKFYTGSCTGGGSWTHDLNI